MKEVGVSSKERRGIGAGTSSLDSDPHTRSANARTNTSNKERKHPIGCTSGNHMQKPILLPLSARPEQCNRPWRPDEGPMLHRLLSLHHAPHRIFIPWRRQAPCTPSPVTLMELESS
jgi:hypothetical protein